MASQAQQRIVLFSGHVQGVGFRYTTCRVAEQFDVSGTVENLSDGKVRVIVEGTSAEIDAFLADLDEHMGQFVRNRSQQTAPASGRFAGFRVVH